MTEAPVTVTPCPPDALLRLEIWGDLAAVQARGDLPPVGRSADTALGRLIWIEPGVWMLRAPPANLAAAITHLEAIAAQDGAVIEISGGLVRHRLSGPAWRELLTIGAVFDVEDPAFAPGRAAATVLHHTAIWIDVIEAAAADVYCLPSYAQELAETWAKGAARMT
ncbi:MAG: sarcosine oxidase subunit gamma family protein [Caulobacteraceae bacterium]|nr:sarcosine oxidase subunit gamma family protein [Caulobacteraceae bacterium]